MVNLFSLAFSDNGQRYPIMFNPPNQRTIQLTQRINTCSGSNPIRKRFFIDFRYIFSLIFFFCSNIWTVNVQQSNNARSYPQVLIRVDPVRGRDGNIYLHDVHHYN